jgi:fructose-1,6-bisphosphatase I
MQGHTPNLTRFLVEREAAAAGATGQFTALMNAIALTGKLISREVNKAGLADILGLTGNRNVQDEEVQKLDIFAHDVMVDTLRSSGTVCIMGSEEMEEAIIVDPPTGGGKYVALFDPLDGSSNIDVAAPIGTIFSILERRSNSGPGELSDLLRPGREQVAAGYVLYGSSTLLVYSTGQGVQSFTLDPSLGEFLLTSEGLHLPPRSKIYSVNESNAPWWPPAVSRWVAGMREGAGKGDYTARYIGSLVADFHRNLLRGGVFAYPADGRDPDKPDGKLRLLYEASPLAFLAEGAGGRASDGRTDILDIIPEALHQRTPLFIGNRREVDEADRCHREEAG